MPAARGSPLPVSTRSKQDRFRRGRTLVRQTSLSLTEVAPARGFAGNSHFSREYRKRFATTPAAGRARP